MFCERAMLYLPEFELTVSAFPRGLSDDEEGGREGVGKVGRGRKTKEIREVNPDYLGAARANGNTYEINVHGW